MWRVTAELSGPAAGELPYAGSQPDGADAAQRRVRITRRDVRPSGPPRGNRVRGDRRRWRRCCRGGQAAQYGARRSAARADGRGHRRELRSGWRWVWRGPRGRVGTELEWRQRLALRGVGSPSGSGSGGGAAVTVPGDPGGSPRSGSGTVGDASSGSSLPSAAAPQGSGWGSSPNPGGSGQGGTASGNRGEATGAAARDTSGEMAAAAQAPRSGTDAPARP